MGNAQIYTFFIEWGFPYIGGTGIGLVLQFKKGMLKVWGEDADWRGDPVSHREKATNQIMHPSLHCNMTLSSNNCCYYRVGREDCSFKGSRRRRRRRLVASKAN